MSGIAYVHKPLVVQAMQVPKRGAPELDAFMAWLVGHRWTMDQGGSFAFQKGDIENVVDPGGWVIKDPTGGLHFCDGPTFTDRYEPLK